MAIACLQQNDYENKLCEKEVKAMNDCFVQHGQEVKMKKESFLKDKLMPGEKRCTNKQLKTLFSQYPIV